MITRINNNIDIEQAIKGSERILTEFDPKWWLEQPGNIALINDVNDVSLFQRILPEVVIGHYFYHSRGRNAIDTATDMLHEIFTGDYNVEVIEGLTLLEKLGARWLSKKLGFKSYGIVQTTAGPCEMVMMTKEEWRTLYG